MAAEPFISTACAGAHSDSSYDLFNGKHFLQNSRNVPSGKDYVEKMKTFLENYELKENTQSILNLNDFDRVMKVCQNIGGRQFTDRAGPDREPNLCISREKFIFHTARKQTKLPNKVVVEEKHLILSCRQPFQKDCLPYHFESNAEGAEPNNEAKGCAGGKAEPSTKIKLTAKEKTQMKTF